MFGWHDVITQNQASVKSGCPAMLQKFTETFLSMNCNLASALRKIVPALVTVESEMSHRLLPAS